MRYRARQGEESERAFDPYGLAYRSGRWYVVGMCHLRKGVRSFRLDRVHSVQSLNESFTRPAKFDALAHLTNSLATIPRAFAVEVLLRTDLEAARRHVYPTVGVLESTADGVLLRAQVDNLAWFARELARLPFEFDIHAPGQLRDELDVVAHRLLERVRS
jgi:predicted DNA-binding transcriptional regulator YafY